jgi:hypothetical protein
MGDLISDLIKRLKDAEKTTAEALSSGSNIHNFDSYQRLLGTREGLLQSLAIIEHLLSEDDEENT